MGVHALHHVPAAPASAVRAKALPRTVQACSLLDGVLRATETPSAALARRLGVDDRIVRDLRAGVRPVTVDRCLDAGRVGAVVLRLAADHAAAGAPQRAPVERHVLACSGAAGELARAVAAGIDALGRALALRDAADALILDLTARVP